MKKILIFTIILTALTACTTLQVQIPELDVTDIPQINMPNPASVYCDQEGGKHEIVTSSDGSQGGICVFSDGSMCDEWSYYRGECAPSSEVIPTPIITIVSTIDASGGYILPGTSEEIADWWGVIKSTPAGAQYDDYFERQDMGQIIVFGIDSMDPTVKSQIASLRDSGKIVHLYGTLFSNVSDYNGSQIVVDRIEVDD